MRLVSSCSAHDKVLPARGKALVKTDLSIAIPEGTYARIAPRSGLAWKHFIDTGAGVRRRAALLACVLSAPRGQHPTAARSLRCARRVASGVLHGSGRARQS